MTIQQSVEELAKEFPGISFSAEKKAWVFASGNRELKLRVSAVTRNNDVQIAKASTFKTAVSIMQHMLRPLEVVEMEK